MPLIVYGLLFILFLIFAGFALALYFEKQQKGSVKSGLEATLFLVMMPKHDQKTEGEAKKEEKAIISQMEQIFSSFLYLQKPKLFQQPYSIAFEIASQIGGADISFYVAVPKYLETAFEKYVQGVYPRAIVEKVPKDYTIFEPSGRAAGAYLKLRENPLFSISTYKVLESDPISTITNNLSKISADEGGAIQVIIRPLQSYSFRKSGEKALELIRKGKPAIFAVKEASSSEILKATGEVIQGPKTKSDKEKEAPEPKQGIDQIGYDAISNKIAKQAFETNIRIVASAKTQGRAEEILGHLESAFSQFSLSAMNSLETKRVHKKELKKLISDFVFRSFNKSQANILNLEELASIYHFPTQYIETPYIKSVKSQSQAPPQDLPEKGINLIGKVLFRGEEKKVYFAAKEDRRRHFYIIGQTGTGKSSLLKEMIRQDIEEGRGVAVIDPHGDLIDHTLSNIPKSRAEDIVLFEPFDLERPMGLNMLEYDSPEQKDFAVQEMIAIFYKLFPPEIIGPMFEHYMRNAMLALMADKDNPGTLVEIPKMFTDQEFLQKRLSSVSDPVVKNFWVKEWAQTTGSTRSDMLGYVVSKVGRFIENEMMRNIVGQGKSGFDLAKIMDEQKIFLANLSKGLTGEVNSSLLGLILVSKMQMAAMKRARLKENERKDFYLYVDEFQNFTTDSIATILSEARKYRLNLIIAHQYIPQLTDQIKNAVLGNVGTIGAFRIGAEDAEFLEKQFEPSFSRFDLVNLDNFNLIAKMMINNKVSTPFKMETFEPKEGRVELADALRKLSKLKYGKPKEEVEKEIHQRSLA